MIDYELICPFFFGLVCTHDPGSTGEFPPPIGQLWFAQQLIHETTTCHHHHTHCHSMDYHIFPSPFSCSIWQTTAREFILLPRLLRWKSIQFLSLGRERTKIKRADRLDYISTTADTFRGVCSKKKFTNEISTSARPHTILLPICCCLTQVPRRHQSFSLPCAALVITNFQIFLHETCKK